MVYFPNAIVKGPIEELLISSGSSSFDADWKNYIYDLRRKMGEFPLRHTYQNAIQMRDSNGHVIGMEVSLGDVGSMQVVDVVAVPHPLDSQSEFLDELMENNNNFLELHSGMFAHASTWHVFALCKTAAGEKYCIPIESIIAADQNLN